MSYRSIAGAIAIAGAIGAGGATLATLSTDAPTTYTVSYTDNMFKAASTAASKSLLTLGARQKVSVAVEAPRTSFAGTAISAVTCSLGTATAGSEAVYVPALSVMQTTNTGTRAGALSGTDLTPVDTSLAVVLHCTATGASFGNGSATVLTAGKVWVTVSKVTLPDGT
jgi:hypothetical protein